MSRSPGISTPRLSTPPVPSHHSVAGQVPHYFVAPLAHPCVSTQKRDALFSTACGLFLIRNFVYPSCFVSAAHSLPKTPGGTHGRSCQKPLGNRPLNQSLGLRCDRLTSTHAISYNIPPSNPFRIYLFRRWGGVGWPVLPYLAT